MVIFKSYPHFENYQKVIFKSYPHFENYQKVIFRLSKGYFSTIKRLFFVLCG